MLQNKIDKNNNYVELNNNKLNQNNEKIRRHLITKRNQINNQKKIRLEENTRFHKDKLKEIEENIKKSFRMHPTQMEKEFDSDNKNGSETKDFMEVERELLRI